MRFFSFCLLLTPLLFAAPVAAQDAPLRVFLDCQYGCDDDYIRREVPFVEYVRDRTDADVHVLVTIQQTGSGGRAYELAFLGQAAYAGTDATLRYAAPSTATTDERRAGLARTLRLGLVSYLAGTPTADRLDVTYDAPSSVVTDAAPTVDPWNAWVFEIELEGGFEAEERRRSYELEPSFSAERITANWKLEFDARGDFRRSRFEVDDDIITNDRTSAEIEGLAVKSLSPHWSAGAFAEARTSTFANLDLRLTAAPAIEYNLFPYDESSRKQLRFLYRLNAQHINYTDSTIYDQTKEFLVSQSLAVGTEVRQPWGDLNAALVGLHYFHDPSFNRIQFSGSIDIRLLRGLELSLRGEIAAIHDQLNLPKGDATGEDVLLRRRELATSFESGISVGITYTFGSIFNSVVNPRFDRIGR